MEYDLFKPWLTLDDWQSKYIETEGNCFLLCGRQSGKTTAMSIKFGKRAATRPNRTILMIAFTEKQAYNLFFKTLMYLEANYPSLIKRGLDKPTQHEINLKNGSVIMCYAAGLKGEGIRTYTITDLVIDEAAPMAREVFISVSPMLSVTGGSMDISSTPRGKEGYFYECSKRDDFTKFYVSAEDCPRHKKEFLENERKTMTKLEYAQEYLAIFLDEFRQFYPTELIKSCMVLKKPDDFKPELSIGNTYLGVDVARMGSDQTVLCSGERIDENNLIQIDLEVTEKTLLTETARLIKSSNLKYDYHRIYIDTTGIGWGVFDILLEDDNTKRKVVAIENAKKSLDYEGKETKTTMKIDLHNNLRNLMEQGKIKLLNDPEILLSLKSVQEDYEDGVHKIFGNRTHIAEATTRMAWCMKSKDLNIYYG